MKKYKDFDSLMRNQKGIKYDSKTANTLINRYDFDKSDVEDINGYLALYAHSDTARKVINLVDNEDLHVITECIFDSDDSVVYSYHRGLCLVNRERFFLTLKDDEFECEEVVR